MGSQSIYPRSFRFTFILFFYTLFVNYLVNRGRVLWYSLLSLNQPHGRGIGMSYSLISQLGTEIWIHSKHQRRLFTTDDQRLRDVRWISVISKEHAGKWNILSSLCEMERTLGQLFLSVFLFPFSIYSNDFPLFPLQNNEMFFILYSQLLF